MSSTSKSRKRSSKPSIKYNGCPVAGSSFELADFTDKDCSSNKNRKNNRNSEEGSSELLTTPELISKVGQIWDRASRPLAFLQPKTKNRYYNYDFAETNILFHYGERKDIASLFSSESERRYLAANSINVDHGSPVAREDTYNLKASDKISSFGPQSWNFLHSLLRESSNSKDKSPTALEISYILRERYKWMYKQFDPELKQQADFTVVESQKTNNEPINGNILECRDSLSDNLGTPISKISEDGHEFEQCQVKDEEIKICASERREEDEIFLKNESNGEVKLPINNKLKYGLVKQEHAFAGALAGLSVSLCLHPVDTIKTVIQTCRANQRSINYIGRSIISERGVTGLYRGITSNIASSAPISAVYTFTYESVKGHLLPLLPMEYQSLAHCTAGGCASIATSFIFTPSERIKQQMQVGSHYPNCWNAIVGIMKTGGLSSLYAGWGAVLCRNVPHSIIKFYTYESLKKLTSSTQEPNAHPNTSQTLFCGGLAGSTAALFTTPFDVVKTRFLDPFAIMMVCLIPS